MKRIKRSNDALRDLDEIWLHVALEDEAAADRLINRLSDSTNRLADFPLSAAARPELGKGVRSLPVRPYAVLHRVERDHVTVLRVIHSARDIREAMRDLSPDDESDKNA